MSQKGGSKRPYKAPSIRTGKVYERQSLACGKYAGSAGGPPGMGGGMSMGHGPPLITCRGNFKLS